jgi:hypothetical protein
MLKVQVKNMSTGFISYIDMPNVSKSQVQAYVDRQNGPQAMEMRRKLNIGHMEYSVIE